MTDCVQWDLCESDRVPIARCGQRLAGVSCFSSYTSALCHEDSMSQVGDAPSPCPTENPWRAQFSTCPPTWKRGTPATPPTCEQEWNPCGCYTELLLLQGPRFPALCSRLKLRRHCCAHQHPRENSCGARNQLLHTPKKTSAALQSFYFFEPFVDSWFEYFVILKIYISDHG